MSWGQHRIGGGEQEERKQAQELLDEVLTPLAYLSETGLWSTGRLAR